MENLTSKYETVFIVNSELGNEQVQAVCDKFKALIEANGTIDEVHEWGKKKFAYPINDMTEGYYMLIEFTSDHKFPAELERVFKITEGILRSLIIKKGE